MPDRYFAYRGLCSRACPNRLACQAVGHGAQGQGAGQADAEAIEARSAVSLRARKATPVHAMKYFGTGHEAMKHVAQNEDVRHVFRGMHSVLRIIRKCPSKGEIHETLSPTRAEEICRRY